MILFFLTYNGRPHLTITADKTKITVLESSYCWNKLLRQECVDYIPPPEQIKEKDVLPTLVTPGIPINIKFSKKPTEAVHVSVWNNDEIDSIDITNNTITAPRERGIYIYIVSSRWSKGSASYVFTIEVK